MTGGRGRCSRRATMSTRGGMAAGLRIRVNGVWHDTEQATSSFRVHIAEPGIQSRSVGSIGHARRIWIARLWRGPPSPGSPSVPRNDGADVTIGVNGPADRLASTRIRSPWDGGHPSSLILNSPPLRMPGENERSLRRRSKRSKSAASASWRAWKLFGACHEATSLDLIADDPSAIHPTQP